MFTEQQTDRPGVAQREVPPLQMILCLGNIPLISASQLRDNMTDQRSNISATHSGCALTSWLVTNPVLTGVTSLFTIIKNINFNIPLVTEGEPDGQHVCPHTEIQVEM